MEGTGNRGREDMAGILDLYRQAAGAGAVDAPDAAELPPPSRRTPSWLFALPLSDLIDNDASPGEGRLPPAMVERCWDVVAEHISEGEKASLSLLLSAESLDAKGAEAIGRRWWPVWGHVLAASLGDSGGMPAEPPNFGQPDHAALIAAILGVAPSVERLKRALGAPPIVRLTPVQNGAVRTEVERLVRGRGGDPRVALHTIAHRLENPAELFLAAADLDLGTASDIGRELVGARETLILSRSADLLARLDVVEADRGAAVLRLERAAAALSAASDLELHGASRIFLRGVAGLQEELADRLGDSVLPGLGAAIAGVWSGSTVTAPPSEARVLEAEDAARALVRLGRSALLIGAEATIRPVSDLALETVRHALGDAERIIADVDASLPERRAAAARLVAGARVIEILAGSDRGFSLVARHRDDLERVWGAAG